MQNISHKNASIVFHKAECTLRLQGEWDLRGIRELLKNYEKMDWPAHQTWIVDGKDIIALDSAGAWLIQKCQRLLLKKHNKVNIANFNEQHTEALELVSTDSDLILDSKPEEKPKTSFLYRLGKNVEERFLQILGVVSLVGELANGLFRGLLRFKLVHFPSFCQAIYHTGYGALPILGLLSFLIGIVLAYQMGLQLQTYGANIFIVYLTGVAVFREFGPLIAAIIVAGRTSSAFTAEIGTMKVNQELDALSTMGISPVRRLVLPKVLGLIAVFPLLVFWSDLWGIIGSMVMSKPMLGIGYPDFIARLQADVGAKNYWIGLSKAPFFAAIIGIVGCYQGFQVSSSADSVGQKTTKSVVQAIFLIIIADAAFSIIYSWAGL